MERVTGIEPAWPAWKAGALPLSYTRMFDAVFVLGLGYLCRSTVTESGLTLSPRLARVKISSRLTTCASGRSVVASAPALGAGDREFESPRPDHNFLTYFNYLYKRSTS